MADSSVVDTALPRCPLPLLPLQMGPNPSRLLFIDESSIWCEWTQPSGISLQKPLEAAITDENSEDMRNGNPKERGLSLELFAHVVWCVVSFVHVRRHLKTRAKAIVKCVFVVLAMQHPELFGDALTQESQAHLRKEAFQA